LAAGKLAIINFGGWIREEIEREQCGIYVDQNHPETFITQVQQFLGNPELLEKYQRAGRKLAEEKYSRKILEKKFFRIIGEVGTR
jgi:glycosyltransferase involved in cell wall biosynthesis